MISELAVFLFAVSAVTCLDSCDKVGELKADTEKCDYFYQCTNSGWVSLQCPSPTVFNPDILACDWADNVECATSSSLGSFKHSSASCGTVGELKADTEKCDHFYQCTHNGWVSLQCQSPTVFNPDILACDWADNVKCAEA